MRHVFWSCIFSTVLVLALSTAGLLSPAMAADDVRLTGKEENGFGRLVFAWPDTGLPEDPTVPDTRLPGYESLVSAGVLVLTFERPLEIDIDDLLRRMPRYLALVRMDADDRTLRMAMKADFKIHAREAGHELYVDLLAPGWAGDAPPLPPVVVARMAAEERERQARAAQFAELGPQALEIVEDLPRVALRVGEQPSFTRLAFEWDRPVLYSTAFRDNRITITFDQVADLPLASLRVDPPALVTSARAEKSGGRLTVFVETEPGVKVRDFREDLSVVLDVAPARPEDVRPVAAAAPAPLLPVPTTAPSEPIEEPESQRAAAAQEAAAAEAAGEEAPVLASAPQEQAAPATTGAGEAALTTEVGQPVPSSEAVAETRQPEEAVTPVRADELVSAYPNPADIDQAALPVTSDLTERSIRLTFPWAEPTKAAIFQRDNRVWMVFDRETDFNLSDLGPVVRERLGDPEIVDLDGASALRFAPPERVLLTAGERDNRWIVTLGDMIVEPTRPVGITRAWSATGEPQVIFDVESVGSIHWVRDPVVYDTIAIVTAKGPPQGLLAPRNFVEFEALSTAQGLALVSRADDLYVSETPRGVTVSRGSGLTLSAADGPDYSGSAPAASRVGDPSAPGRMDFERWRYSPGKNFIERKQFHQRAVALADDADVAEARIKYAKFLLSYRLGTEAYTMLQGAVLASETMENDPGFRALRGVAQIMMARPEEAIADLAFPALDGDPHSSLWRGVAYAELAQWGDARLAFEQAEKAFEIYGPDLQALFRMKAAEASLATGDLGSVEFNLDRIPAGADNGRWAEQSDLTRGRLYEALGRADEALEIYDQLLTSDHRAILARARFAHANLRHELGAMSDEELTKELHALRLVWRGDDLELAVLERLGELLIAKGEVAEGLEIWRMAVGTFPETERARRVASAMTETFTDLYLDGGADDMDPVEALSIYYEFRELTPIGRRGDALIRNLADRMVEVDLLDKAATLLRHQVDNRLRGTAQAQVAAKLALIELMNRQPTAALRAIRSTKQVRLPKDLTHKRRLLEARALTDLGLYDHALDLLSETDGEGVADLVANIHWESQQWAVAAANFETALGERWRDPLPLTEDERFQVLRAAISFSLDDDAVGLERMRAKFGDLMSASPDAAAFAVVTDPIQTNGVAFRDLARSVASIDTLDSFVQSMEGSFSEPLDGADSAIN
ncbi:MAG: tetratricopeptide repeat protein [Rhodobiaceae bacterium]|nr:tetratricopeptide repeat protein [Rhodobiaceae bacterium]